MTIHFHVGHVPITFSLGKSADIERELEEKTAALIDLGLRLPIEGAAARYIVRRWARATR